MCSQISYNGDTPQWKRQGRGAGRGDTATYVIKRDAIDIAAHVSREFLKGNIKSGDSDYTGI